MKDLIYRNELRKELSKIHAEMGLCSKTEVMNVVGRQSKANTNGLFPNWIKTKSNQLPEDGQQVIVYNTQTHSRDVVVFDHQDYWYDGTITHWMPMPPAPAPNQ